MRFLFVAVFLFSLNSFALDDTYFAGEDVMKSPDGKVVYSSNPKLLKRSINKSSSEIFEEVILKVYQGDFETQMIKLKVTGSTFTLSTTAYDVVGEFYGTPWAWSGWVTKFELPNGARLKVLDHLSDAGLSAVSEYYDSAGKLVSVTFTEMKKVEKSTFEALKLKLLGH